MTRCVTRCVTRCGTRCVTRCGTRCRTRCVTRCVTCGYGDGLRAPFWIPCRRLLYLWGPHVCRWWLTLGWPRYLAYTSALIWWLTKLRGPSSLCALWREVSISLPAPGSASLTSKAALFVSLPGCLSVTVNGDIVAAWLWIFGNSALPLSYQSVAFINTGAGISAAFLKNN